MENKPSVLYRGLKIKYNDLKNYKFVGEDLVVNYEPIIDEYGRKVVSDGNEYGVYMCDNPTMVEEAYGNLRNDGIELKKNLTICGRRVLIPSVGVIYKINTEGLDVRRPFITDYLKGHYNNGYAGDEWITDRVPAKNYVLHRVRIGNDILHDAEDIDLSRVDSVEDVVLDMVEKRKQRLEVFSDAMSRLPSFKRDNFTKTDLEVLRLIYGKVGLKYINEECLITDNVDGMTNYLLSKSFKRKEPDIDFSTLIYVYNMKSHVSRVEDIVVLLKKDKLRVLEEKRAYIEKKESIGETVSTGYFDSQLTRIDELLELINKRIVRDRQEAEVNAMLEMEEVSTNLEGEKGHEGVK